LGKARRNLFIGLRTPWTLANATVWDKTQRFTGRGLVLGGLTLVALGFALRDTGLFGAAIGLCAAAPIVAGIARSRSLYRGLQRT
ncbi:MAG TPA: SdpI family protein, partial [Phenylobacterium sp.]|nr:SdpI family protein [Phenylobacterium sp.]